MKKRGVSKTLTFNEIYGRLPTPKKGGAMTSKKGKKGYTRNMKHKGWSNDHPFPILTIVTI